MSDNAPKTNGLRNISGTVTAIVLFVAGQLGFSIWWAAHMDQIALQIIERANKLDEHVNRLDAVGGAKVHENTANIETLLKSDAGLVRRVERLEVLRSQVTILDERIKSVQIQASTNSDRINALSQNTREQVTLLTNQVQEWLKVLNEKIETSSKSRSSRTR